MTHQPHLVLASASPRRADLLRKAGFSLTIHPANICETQLPDEPAETMVRRLAHAKATQVAPLYPQQIVLGADTVVLHDETPMGKPASRNEARTMLATLSGNTHDVITGVCLFRQTPALEETWTTTTTVTFQPLTPERIDTYIKRVNVLDKAGAYAIQEYGEMLVAGIKGLRSNVIGLPVEELLKRLVP